MVYYCSVCTLPPEYCEFSPTYEKCKTKLQEENPELYHVLHETSNAEQAQDKNLAVKGLTKKMAKTNIKDTKVVIKRVERNKKKSTTVISGLEHHEIDLKKAAKRFASRFACGCSVSDEHGFDEIVIQGDLSDVIKEFLLSEFSQLKPNMIDLAAPDLKRKK